MSPTQIRKYGYPQAPPQRARPDDGTTDIAYEKGAFFLTLKKAGRENPTASLKQYFKAHQFQTLTTGEFVGIPERNPDR